MSLFGPYRARRSLGEGSMGCVHLAEDTRSGKQVALKVLRETRSANAVATARFAREARAASKLSHRNVVSVIEASVDEHPPWIAFELIDGRDFEALLADRGRIPLDELVTLMLPVLAAVAHAHEEGVVHRDLKPANILIDENGPKVSDFGVSKLADDVEALTADDTLLGTIAYMAPEQIRAPADVDERTDQWALAVILYRAATGVLPFQGATSWSVMQAIVDGKIVPPSTRAPELPESFDRLILKALTRDPERRFASVSDLAAALRVCADSGATVDDGRAAPPRPRAKKRDGTLYVALTAALIGLGAYSASRLRARAAPTETPTSPATTPASVVAPVTSASSVPSAVAIVAPASASGGTTVGSTAPIRVAQPSKPVVTSVAPKASASVDLVPPPPPASPSKVLLGENGAPILE
ncbi:MAG: protein kinase domain-containing protein [Polyangiales bacterium]